MADHDVVEQMTLDALDAAEPWADADNVFGIVAEDFGGMPGGASSASAGLETAR